MTRATLEQIGALGHVEKQAARDYAPTAAPMFAETAVRLAFLQGILWERKKAQAEQFGRMAALVANVAAAHEQAKSHMLLYGECLLALGPQGFRVLDPTKVKVEQ